MWMDPSDNRGGSSALPRGASRAADYRLDVDGERPQYIPGCVVSVIFFGKPPGWRPWSKSGVTCSSRADAAALPGGGCES